MAKIRPVRVHQSITGVGTLNIQMKKGVYPHVVYFSLFGVDIFCHGRHRLGGCFYFMFRLPFLLLFFPQDCTLPWPTRKRGRSCRCSSSQWLRSNIGGFGEVKAFSGVVRLQRRKRDRHHRSGGRRGGDLFGRFFRLRRSWTWEKRKRYRRRRRNRTHHRSRRRRFQASGGGRAREMMWRAMIHRGKGSRGWRW